MTADRFVRAPSDEIPRSRPHRERNASGERQEPEPEEYGDREKREQDVFPEAVVFEPRKKREEVQAAPLENGDAFPERLWVVPNVGVGEEKDLAGRRLRTEEERVGLAEPAGRRVTAGDDR